MIYKRLQSYLFSGLLIVVLLACGGGDGNENVNAIVENDCPVIEDSRFQSTSLDSIATNRDCVSSQDDFLNTNSNYWDCSSGRVTIGSISVSGRTQYNVSESLDGTFNIHLTDSIVTATVISADGCTNSRGKVGYTFDLPPCFPSREILSNSRGKVGYTFDRCNVVTYTQGENTGFVIDNLNGGSMEIFYGYDIFGITIDGIRATLNDVVYHHTCRLRTSNSKSVSKEKSETVQSESIEEIDPVLPKTIKNLLIRD